MTLHTRTDSKYQCKCKVNHMSTTPKEEFEKWSWVGYGPAIGVFTTANVFWVTTSLLYYFRRNHEYLIPRSQEIVTINVICTIVVTNQFMFDFPVLQIGQKIPCVWYMIVYYFVAPIWLLTLFLRTGHLLLSHVSAQARLELSIHGKILIYTAMNRFDRAMLRLQFFFFGSNPEQWLAGNNRKLTLWQLMKSILILTGFEAVLFIIAVAVKKGNLEQCQYSDYTVLLVVMGGFLFSIPYLLYCIRGINDSFRIRREIALTLTNIIAFMIIYLIFQTFAVEISPTGNNIFLAAFGFGIHLIQVVYPLIISFMSDYRWKHLSLSRESFEKTLDDPVLFQELKKVMAEGFTIENALFVEAYREMRKRTTQFPYSTSIDPSEMIVDIGEDNVVVPGGLNKEGDKAIQSTSIFDQQIVLFNKFIKVGAPYELNISHHVRLICERKLWAGGSDSDVMDVFEEVYDEVSCLIYRNSFPRFVRRMQSGPSKTNKVAPS
ncbi:hypothetical protein HK102_002489 [Quaeritorhiza haematococci]|nr:hypothetical protein HK102_002489 [Quaeritorhiza haematococci]